nr:MAG TPA: hypothetical protein [Caudoviricetes sp.]
MRYYVPPSFRKTIGFVCFSHHIGRINNHKNQRIWVSIIVKSWGCIGYPMLHLVSFHEGFEAVQEGN